MSFFRNCIYSLVMVEVISFDDLETVRIANEPHWMRPIARHSFAYSIGNTYPVSEEVFNLDAGIQYESFYIFIYIKEKN